MAAEIPIPVQFTQLYHWEQSKQRHILGSYMTQHGGTLLAVWAHGCFTPLLQNAVLQDVIKNTRCVIVEVAVYRECRI